MPIKPNRLFYTVKLDSGTILAFETKEEKKKDRKYNVVMNLKSCKTNGNIISLADSQMLKSIRDITNNNIDMDYVESLYQERDRLKHSKKSNLEIIKKIESIQDEIFNIMYIPQYITVVMGSVGEYKKIYKKGFYFNGKHYIRGGCSASQARLSTIVFIQEDISEELRNRLDNGRDLGHKLAASKFNAYYGLYSSASKKVTKPRFCIIPDYNSNKDVDVDWSIQNGWDDDDIIEKRTVNFEFNRFDGSGLISPAMAKIWGYDLNEDYTPCQFIIRTSFTKGLVNEFDFVEWCRDELEGVEGKDGDNKYFITDIYGKKIDLREIDVILTEGMAKLWDSWESQESFEQNCEKNGIDWRVTKYTPKKDKNASTLNYQYIQTLNFENFDEDGNSVLNPEIVKLCDDTIEYIRGVTLDNPYYSILFQMGIGKSECEIETDENGSVKYNYKNLINFLLSSDNNLLKCCILNHELFNDKYVIDRLREDIAKKIQLACLGRLYDHGNYQFIIPDSYAFMQWATGQEVTGILNDHEVYSMYWEKYEKDRIGCARSPMTAKKEWIVNRNVY